MTLLSVSLKLDRFKLNRLFQVIFLLLHFLLTCCSSLSPVCSLYQKMSDGTTSLNLSSNSSLSSSDYYCSITSIFVLTAFSVTYILLIFPLCTLILYLGYQRRKQPLYPAAMSPSDMFTYHILVMEMITVSACLSICICAYYDLQQMIMNTLDFFFSLWSTKIHFHTLTCVEQYLAVVHPVSYLSLKSKRGIRIRNLSIACVWLCLVCTTAAALTDNTFDVIVFISVVAFALLVVCFCCTSVLCALRRPAPGVVDRSRKQLHQKKQRAFYTIVLIMTVMTLCLGEMLVSEALDNFLELSTVDDCVVIKFEIWFSLPSSLVLPLLYLHRAGKLTGCKHISESG